MDENVGATDWDRLLAAQSATPEEIADGENRIIQGWELRTLADAYQTRPPIVEIVASIMTEGSLNVWYGAPGSKKSLILADMMTCIASGGVWLDHLPGNQARQSSFQTIKGACLWLDFDNGTRRTDDRFAAFGRAYNVPDSAPLYYISMPHPWLDASSLSMIEDLARLIERRKIIALIMDNLGAIIGKTDENTGEMAPVMSNLRWLCNSTGVSSNLIHHQRKTSAASNGTTLGRAESLRGHSSILANLDQAFHVEPVEDSDNIMITPAKQRDYAAFENLSAMFTFEHVEGTRTMSTARFWGIDGASANDQDLARIESSIIDAVSSTPGASQQEIITDVRASLSLNGKPPAVNRIRGVLKQLIDANKVITRVGERSNKARLCHYKP